MPTNERDEIANEVEAGGDFMGTAVGPNASVNADNIAGRDVNKGVGGVFIAVAVVMITAVALAYSL